VLHSNSEEHEVHSTDLVVVLFHLLFKDFLKLVLISNALKGSFVTFSDGNELGVDERLSEDDIRLEVTEFLHGVTHEFVVLIDVLLKDESI
jgi:hypothetical protein